MYFKDIQSRLWSEHTEEVQKFSSSPGLLPEYQKEWLKFVHKRTSMITALGGNPATYDYKTEFNATWTKIFDSIMNNKWQLKDKLCRKLYFDTQQPHDISSIINKVYEEVNSINLSDQSLTQASRGSDIHNSLSSVLCEEFFRSRNESSSSSNNLNKSFASYSESEKISRSRSSDRKNLSYSESRASVKVYINLANKSRSRSVSKTRKYKSINYKRSETKSFSRSRSRSVSSKMKSRSYYKERSSISNSFSKSRSRSISQTRKSKSKYKKKSKSDYFSRSRSISMSRTGKSKYRNKKKSKSKSVRKLRSRSISKTRISKNKNKIGSKSKSCSGSRSRSKSVSKTGKSKRKSREISGKSKRKKYLKKDKYSSRSRSRSHSISCYDKHRRSTSITSRSTSTGISSRPSSRTSSNRGMPINSYSGSRSSSRNSFHRNRTDLSEQSHSPSPYIRNRRSRREFKHSKYKNCSRSRSKSKTPSLPLSKHSQSHFSKSDHKSKSELPNLKDEMRNVVDSQAIQCTEMKVSYSAKNKYLGNSVNLFQNRPSVIADKNKIVSDFTASLPKREQNYCPNTSLVEKHSMVLDAMDEFLKEQASIKLNEVNNTSDYDKHLKHMSLNVNPTLENILNAGTENKLPVRTISPPVNTTLNINSCQKERVQNVINAMTEQNSSLNTSKVEKHSLLLDEMEKFLKEHSSIGLQLNEVIEIPPKHNSPNVLPLDTNFNNESKLVESSSPINRTRPTQNKNLCEKEKVQNLINDKMNFVEYLKNDNISPREDKKRNLNLDTIEIEEDNVFRESFFIAFRETLLYLQNNEDLLGIYPSVVNALLLDLLTTDTSSLIGLTLDQNIALSLILDKLRLDLCKKSLETSLRLQIQEAISKINLVISKFTLKNEKEQDNCPIFFYGHDVVDIATRTVNKSAEETNKFIDLILLHDGFDISTSEPFENLYKMVANLKEKKL